MKITRKQSKAVFINNNSKFDSTLGVQNATLVSLELPKVIILGVVGQVGI